MSVTPFGLEPATSSLLLGHTPPAHLRHRRASVPEVWRPPSHSRPLLHLGQGRSTARQAGRHPPASAPAQRHRTSPTAALPRLTVPFTPRLCPARPSCAYRLTFGSPATLNRTRFKQKHRLPAADPRQLPASCPRNPVSSSCPLTAGGLGGLVGARVVQVRRAHLRSRAWPLRRFGRVRPAFRGRRPGHLRGAAQSRSAVALGAVSDSRRPAAARLR